MISYLRRFTQSSRNLTPRWKGKSEVPSGWANVSGEPNIVQRGVGTFYEYLKRQGTAFAPGSPRQKALQQSARAYIDAPRPPEATSSHGYEEAAE